MNAKDIRAEAEKRLAEIEAEAVELRKMLGKDAPAPQFVPYPAPVYVPTIQPYVAPYIPVNPFDGWQVNPFDRWPYRPGDVICTGTTSGKISVGGTPGPTTTTTIVSGLLGAGLSQSSFATLTGTGTINNPGIFTTTLDGAAAPEFMAKHGLTFNVDGAPGGSGAWS